MNYDEADTVMEVLSGYWPTPPLTDEEVKAWLTELCGRMRITTEEASKVIAGWARSGETFRLRPGQIIAEVQALRRRRAFDRPQIGALEPVAQADVYGTVAKANLDACRRACEAGQATQTMRRERVRDMAK